MDKHIERFSADRRTLQGFNGNLEDLMNLLAMLKGFKNIHSTLRKMSEASSNINWVKCSPDGMIGGAGHIIPLQDLRKFLSEMSEDCVLAINSLTDECYNNPFWNEPKNAYRTSKQEDPGLQEPTPDEEPPEEKPLKEPNDNHELDFEFVKKSSSEKNELDFGFVGASQDDQDEDSVISALETAREAGCRMLTLDELSYVTAAETDIGRERVASAIDRLQGKSRIHFGDDGMISLLSSDKSIAQEEIESDA